MAGEVHCILFMSAALSFLFVVLHDIVISKDMEKFNEFLCVFCVS
jgi:hypothetical protein